MLNIIQKRNIWLSISGILVALSIVALFSFGLRLGIDFTGGSLLEVRFDAERPSVNQVQEALSGLNLKSLIVQPIGDDGFILRFQDIEEDTHQEVLAKLRSIVGETSDADIIDQKDNDSEIIASSTTEITIGDTKNVSKVEELRFDSVGPSIGQELKQKSFSAIILVILAIVGYIAYVFRHVSKPIQSWKYGVVAIIALVHDVAITLGVFAILGKYMGQEINTPFVAAILTVLGYSVNDSIVVFDRIRENLPKSDDDFEDTVNRSVNETIQRSINTSLTTLLVLISILIFGGESIRSFVGALAVGIFIGTYSSIFLASPLLVMWEKMRSDS